MSRQADSSSDGVGQAPVAPAGETPRREANHPVRRVLVVAYYFPPMGLSGVQRTAKFVKFLPRFGWQPTVITCEPRGYFAFDDSLWAEVQAAGVDVVRTHALDPTRLFRRRAVVALPDERRRKWFSALSQFLFVPDNKIGWYAPAVKAGLKQFARQPFDVIFSTAPPYTAHLIGRTLSRRTEAPLVLDFRDDWIGNPRHDYPTPLHRQASSGLERRALRASRRIVVINEEIRRNLIARNEGLAEPENVTVIPQGFDPEDFESAAPADRRAENFVLLYSGVFYDAQTPEFFLRGLADFLNRRADLRGRVEARFAGLLPESAMALARELGVESAIRYVGYLPHKELIRHLLAADALWMTVGRQEGAETISTSKLFEYFGTRKPVLGLVPRGAARDALTRYGAAEFAQPDAVPEISASIGRLYDAWKRGEMPLPDEDVVHGYDRVHLTGRLTKLFENILEEQGRD